jgi:hypothetical protein
MSLTSALISDCGRYRYELIRQWDEGLPPLTFIMLNPSTADATLDDPTIRRCIRFARERGFGVLRVLNLFAFRATDPAQMRAQDDPVGPDNDKHLRSAITGARDAKAPVIAAWGVHGAYKGRDVTVRALARECDVSLTCLGRTRDGHPRHPLYVPAAADFAILS